MNEPLTIGTTRTSVVEVKVCKSCNSPVDLGLCSYECPADGDHKPGTFLTAVYERSETLVRVDQND